MRTYRDGSGSAVAGFEVSNLLISTKQIAMILRSVEGVRDVHERRSFSHQEELLKFSYSGVPGVVIEPFGDSSRYWIGPADPENPFETVGLERAFKDHRLGRLRRIIATITEKGSG